MEVRNYGIPIWKRPQHVPPIVTSAGSKPKKEYVNSIGTAVTQELCNEILWYDYPKNLIDVVKEHAGHAPPPVPLGPVDFEDDGRMKVPTIEKCIQRVYPGAISNESLRKAVLSVLADEGMNFSNSYLVNCRSLLETSRVFKKDWLFPGEYVNIGGEGGLPFGGIKALEMALRRVPESCCMILLYTSHTGVDPAGNMGFVQRLDEETGVVTPPMQTCWAGIKAYKLLVADPEHELTKAERSDRQYSAIFDLVKEHFDHISESDVITECIAHVILRRTRETLLKYFNELGKTVPSAANTMVVLMGGVQIETPAGMPDYFKLMDLEIRSGPKPENLKSFVHRLQYFLDREHLHQEHEHHHEVDDGGKKAD